MASTVQASPKPPIMHKSGDQAAWPPSAGGQSSSQAVKPAPPTSVPTLDTTGSPWHSATPLSDLDPLTPYANQSDAGNSNLASPFDPQLLNDLDDFDKCLYLRDVPDQSIDTVDPRHLFIGSQVDVQEAARQPFQPAPSSSPAPRTNVRDRASPQSNVATSGSQSTAQTNLPSPATTNAASPGSQPAHSSFVNVLHKMGRPHASLATSHDAQIPDFGFTSPSPRQPSSADPRQRAKTTNAITSQLQAARRGLGPDERARLSGAEVPSLEEQDQQHSRRKTDAEVTEWLTSTTADPPNSNVPPKTNDPKLAYKYHKAANGFDLIPASGPGFDWEADEGSDLDERPPTPPGSKLFVAQSRAQAKRAPLKEGLQGTLRHWEDSAHNAETSSIREAPPESSTAAMERFLRRAKEADAASVAASYGSSTRRGTDTASVFSGFSSRVPSIAMQGGQMPGMLPSQRRESLLDRVQGRVQKTFHRNSDPNSKKRKESQGGEKRKESYEPEYGDYMSQLTKSDSDGSQNTLRKTSSGNQKVPTSHDFTARPGLSPNTAASFAATLNQRSGGLHLPGILRRSRSRSDVTAKSALAQQWAAQGGPPIAIPRPYHEQAYPEQAYQEQTYQEQVQQEQSYQEQTQQEQTLEPMPAFEYDPDEDVPPDFIPPTQQTAPSGHADEVATDFTNLQVNDGVVVDDEDDDDGSRTPTAPDPSRQMAIPLGTTLEDFKAHARQVAGDLPAFLVDRLAQEQVKRYQRLSQLREDHARAVQHGSCKSGKLCPQSHLSGIKGPRLIRPKGRSNKDAASAIYKVNTNTPISEIQFLDLDETPQQASFPYGIPHPPVKQLPAEFECPICFRVKKIAKPSDWTKHCFEDLHPFTCTFADCQQPKSFNRKADWTRHENETHRHIESWVCSFPKCGHVCHRRDNFVQHLVRVHNLQESKPPPSKPGQPRRKGADDTSEVARLVISCRYESTQEASTAPCIFCGAAHRTWRDASAHLSKHMLQTSLPLLIIVEQQNGKAIAGPQKVSRPQAQGDGMSKVGSMPSGTGNFGNTGMAIPQARSQQQGYMQQQTSQSFPGTKNMARQPSPSNGNQYLDVGYHQQYASSLQQEQGAYLTPMSDNQGRRSPSTYPPAISTPGSGGNSFNPNFLSTTPGFDQQQQADFTMSPSVGGGEMAMDVFGNDMNYDEAQMVDQSQQTSFAMDDGTNLYLGDMDGAGYTQETGYYHLPDGAHPGIYFPTSDVQMPEMQAMQSQYGGSPEGQGFYSQGQSPAAPSAHYPGWTSSSENLLRRLSRSHSHSLAHTPHDGIL